MKQQNAVAVHQDNLCPFPTVVHSASIDHQHTLQVLELRRLISYLLHGIKEIACAQQEPLRLLTCIASGDEISPVLDHELRADFKACAYARMKEVGARAAAYLEFLDKKSDW
jgi:hypothetical protein